MGEHRKMPDENRAGENLACQRCRPGVYYDARAADHHLLGCRRLVGGSKRRVRSSRLLIASQSRKIEVS